MGKWEETIGVGFGTARKAGTDKVKPVQDEERGGVAGHEIEHWDGSQDAVVNIQPIRAGASHVQGAEH